ncbi:MAG: hypothetical protein ABI318_18860 [Chthoniobacteraceae bacterium]
MLDLLAWVLTINENANLREQLDQADKRLARLPPEKRIAALQAENQDLKIRLGVIIRLLAEKGVLDGQEIVAAYKHFKAETK